ncbi:MAG: hypothetical protein ACLRMZ_28140 [Blautia marasmi]
MTDIAFHAGYNSRQHFGSTFENTMGKPQSISAAS